MKSVLLEVKNGLEEIRKFIESSNLQYKIFKDTRKVFKKNSEIFPVELKENYELFISHYELFVNKKIFEYNAIIISLYGYLENYLEELIKAYIQKRASLVKNFSDMPEKIINNHTILSAQLIKNLSLPKYSNLSTQSIVRSMASCEENNDFQINLDAYTYHSSNFRENSINEFFSQVGINNISGSIKRNLGFTKYLEEKEIAISIAFEKLDELAERRNQVSHGAVDNILEKEILSEYIEYIELYCTSIFEVLEEEILRYQISLPNSFTELNKPIKVINNSIVCLKVENVSFKIGDTIFAKNIKNNNIRFGEILSIQEGTILLTEVSKEYTGCVGIKVDFYAKENWEYSFLL